MCALTGAILHDPQANSRYFSRRPTARVTGGWGEKGPETETCHSSEPAPKNAQSPSRPVHAVLGVSFAITDLLVFRFIPVHLVLYSIGVDSDTPVCASMMIVHLSQ